MVRTVLQVGSSSNTDEDETVEEFVKLGLRKPEETVGDEEHYPKLMRLVSCQVRYDVLLFIFLVLIFV